MLRMHKLVLLPTLMSCSFEALEDTKMYFTFLETSKPYLFEARYQDIIFALNARKLLPNIAGFITVSLLGVFTFLSQGLYLLCMSCHLWMLSLVQGV